MRGKMGERSNKWNVDATRRPISREVSVCCYVHVFYFVAVTFHIAKVLRENSLIDSYAGTFLHTKSGMVNFN